ncbi:unnamed protein product [Calypogeia fissa]
MGMDIPGDFPVAGEGSTDDNLVLAREWMQRALSSVSQGDSGNYRKMLTDLRDVRAEDAASISGLQLRLRALSHSVYFISESYHQALLDHLLGMSVWTYEGDVADSLLAFVVNLASANGACVGQCMDMLVRNFLPPSCGLASFLDTYSKAGLMYGWLSMEQLRGEETAHMAKKEDVLNRLHAAIKQIAALVPTTPLRMQPLIFKRMPHRSSAKEWILLYLENMLRVESSGGQYHGNQMLPAIVDHLIQIDVEIRWEDILSDDDTGKVYMFHMDVEEETEDCEGNGCEAGGEAGDAVGPGMEGKSLHGLMKRPSSQNKVATLDEMADKMDAMMDMILDHLQRSVKRGLSLHLYGTLMKSFQSTILHTHKSKFTQFIIFYLCALEPITCGSRFASLLCDIFSSRTRPSTTRISAAAYLASYLARAKFLSSDVICASLKRMVSWCIAYGSNEVINSAPTVPDAIAHGVFFSVCQAVMYTLCFRFKMLVEDPEGKRVLRGLTLQQLLNHRLNPIKVCLPSVVDEFLKKAAILQLVDQQQWLLTKERIDRNTGGDVRLDMFFPFDPYLLRQSDRFIRPNFNFWYMVEPLGENEVSDLEGCHNDAESDISSDTEYQHDGSPSTHRDEFPGEDHIDDDHVDDYHFNSMKSNTRNFDKTGEAFGLDSHFLAYSPCSDDGFIDTFQNSFDAMAITPPHALKMPAKLPAQLPAKFSIPSFHT